MTVTSGYQDAWNTAGWTAQWANLPNATLTSPSADSFRLPPGLTGMSVTGKWYDQYGPAWGNLLFTPSVSKVVVNDVEVALSPFRVYLQNGELPSTFAVPAPDTGAVVAPTTWNWNVTGRVGPNSVNYVIPIPAGTVPFDLIADGTPTI